MSPKLSICILPTHCYKEFYSQIFKILPSKPSLHLYNCKNIYPSLIELLFFCLGPRFLSGTTYGLELVNEFRQQTRALAKYSQLVATETDSNLIRMENELKKDEILLLHKLDQLKKDIYKRLFKIEEVS